MNYKKIYSAFLTLLLALSLIPQSVTRAAAFNLTAKPECGFIMLQWDRVPDAVRYYVYRGPGEGQEYPMPLTDFAIPETYYKDTTDLVMNQKYCYFIKAVNGSDQEFLQSIEACATFTCDEEIPEPPEIADEDCKMVLKYQVGNKNYWKNDIPKGPMDVSPELKLARVNLMMRYLSEEVGATVGWDGSTQTVKVTTLDGKTIELQIGNHIAKINGVPTPIDPNNSSVVPYISGGRTFTPLRFSAYNLGATGPVDIIWQAETKTAVLIFKDPHCKWVCGCIRKLPPNSATANVTQYGFFEDCNKEKPQYTKIPLEMKDNILKLSFLEYMKKYPNQDYWCVELRVDENGNVVGWRARPDQYPNCCKPKPPTDCKWVCGCVRKWTEAPNGNISIFFTKDCKENTDFLTFLVPSTLKDTNLGITWLEYVRKYANQKYWCVELCIGPNNNIVAWKATPAKYPNCCEEIPVDCKWVPGYISKAVQTPGTNLWTVSFAVNCKAEQIVDLQFDGSLLDLNLSILLSDYIKKYPNHKYWCVEFCIDVNRKIVKWKATPEKYPNCCEEIPVDCKWVCGCILKAGPSATSNMWYIAFSPDCDTTNVQEYQMSPALVDANLNMTIADYIKKYPDHKYWCVELCIDANKKIVKWRATPQKYPKCCEEEPVKKLCACIVRMTIQPDVNGMYQVYIKKDCDPNPSPAYDLVLNFPATLLDTNLGLNALDYYNSIPGDPPKMCCIEVKFNSAMVVTQWSAHPDRTPCCDVTDKGRILAYIPTKCIEGTTFVVTDLQGVVVWKGQATNEGILDTGCVLKCPEKYRITPKNEKCKFNPEFQDVYVPCCPEKAEVKFDCDCNPATDGGRIIVNMPKECLPGTVVYIYDMVNGAPGKVVWKGEANSDGVFDTGCKLLCPATYVVVPKNEKCKFIRESIEVKVLCCPEVTKVVFDCDCSTPKGRIKVFFPLECTKGTKVTINDSTGVVVWSGEPVSNGQLGVCDTGDNPCILKCPGTYTVTPTNPNYLFDPTKQTVELTKDNCCPSFKEIRFSCKPKKVKAEIMAMFGDDCKECLDSITVYITKTDDGTDVVSGKPVWTAGGFNKWIYDTGCNLECPGKYTVTPKSSTGCTFTPASWNIEFSQAKGNCCDKFIYEGIGFKCTPAPKKGRILGTVGTACAGAVISITKVSTQREQIYTFKTDATGAFDTECMLECGATYTVTPTKDGCTFTPSSAKVTINSCCPNGYEKVSFECNCKPPEEKGRIKGKVFGNCNPNTMVTIYDEAGTAVWYGPTDANGYFETSAEGAVCKIKCPGKYKIVPTKQGCTISPASQEVTLSERMCCEDKYVAQVDFKCDCPAPSKKGRITGYVPRNCVDGTSIVIYGASGDVVWKGYPNDNGYFETSAQGKDCILDCPGTYKVVPTKKGCTFTPESQVVTLSERMCCDYTAMVEFKCDCAGTPLSNIPKQEEKIYLEKISYLSNDTEALKII